jgi:hypothetical protein
MINARITKRFVFVGLCLSLIFFPYNNSNSANSNSAVIEVKKYCELDFNGARIPEGDYEKLRNLMAWEEDQDEPGWDCFIIISDYKIMDEKVKKNAAKVTVRYNVLSRICSDYSLEKKRYADKVDYELVKIHGFWKIKEYVPYPRISKDVALKYLKNRLKLLKQDSVEKGKIDSLIKNLEKL